MPPRPGMSGRSRVEAMPGSAAQVPVDDRRAQPRIGDHSAPRPGAREVPEKCPLRDEKVQACEGIHTSGPADRRRSTAEAIAARLKARITMPSLDVEDRQIASSPTRISSISVPMVSAMAR